LKKQKRKTDVYDNTNIYIIYNIMCIILLSCTVRHADEYYLRCVRVCFLYVSVCDCVCMCVNTCIYVCVCVYVGVWVCICVCVCVCECRVWEGNGHNARTRDAVIRVCVVGWPTARTERLPRRQKSAERNAAVGAAPPYQNQYFPSRARHIPFVPVTSSPVVHMVFDGNLLFPLVVFRQPLLRLTYRSSSLFLVHHLHSFSATRPHPTQTLTLSSPQYRPLPLQLPRRLKSATVYYIRNV